ncbi:Thioredoxin-like fold protein [Niveomyces insectorum RCEF 264]|uniref:thioredoxin-dependent peroxiredoxin n=1 Tax=Niveomyces insectorum RCEF 264 TaxID=1081102 RepID=A0A167XQJ4_9HYPO|nr:Thioredoxin-like fold protein [Niveomyces insectorum RCEF 264]
MATQEEELSAVFSGFLKNAPDDAKNPILAATADIVASFDRSAAIQEGQPLPAFQLPDALGKTVSSTELLKKGPILITFYRGTWCPFCNIALAHLQKHLAAFAALGVTVVAISPELPDTSLSETEKRGLTFPVLSDVGNAYARTLGIVWTQPDTLRPVFAKFGHNVAARNGDDSFAVPVPTTLLVDGAGVVRRAYIEPDYKKRLDPTVALQWAREL